MARKKYSGGFEEYESKLKRVMERLGVKQYKYDWSRNECFIEFTKRQDESLIKTAIHSQYLVVVRAFTKIYGIPGVRLGYLATSEKMVECLKRQLPGWNVSLLAQCAGEAALQEDEFVQKTSEYVKKQREYLTEKLRLLGLTV